MTKYERPDILRVDNLAEGVYLASTATDDGKPEPVCGSIYLKGVWQRPNGTHGNQRPVIEVRGCEGCSADDGDGCKITKGKTSDLNANGDFRPTWERNGLTPDTMVW